MNQTTAPLLQPHEQPLHAQLAVCTTSFFHAINDIDLQAATPQTDDTIAPDAITAVVNFSGKQQGFMLLSCSELLAERLCVGMLGEQGDYSHETLEDVMGEAVSILAANLTEHSNPERRYRFSVPSVLHGTPNQVRQLLDDKRGHACSFSHTSGRVLVKLVVSYNSCTPEPPKHSQELTSQTEFQQPLLVCPCCGYTGNMLPYSGTSREHQATNGLPSSRQTFEQVRFQ